MAKTAPKQGSRPAGSSQGHKWIFLPWAGPTEYQDALLWGPKVETGCPLLAAQAGLGPAQCHQADPGTPSLSSPLTFSQPHSAEGAAHTHCKARVPAEGCKLRGAWGVAGICRRRACPAPIDTRWRCGVKAKGSHSVFFFFFFPFILYLLAIPFLLWVLTTLCFCEGI